MDYTLIKGHRATIPIWNVDVGGVMLVIDREQGDNILLPYGETLTARWIVLQSRNTSDEGTLWSPKALSYPTLKKAKEAAAQWAESKQIRKLKAPIEPITPVHDEQQPSGEKPQNPASNTLAKGRDPSPNGNLAERSSKDNDSFSERNGGNGDVQQAGSKQGNQEEPIEAQEVEVVTSDQNDSAHDPPPPPATDLNAMAQQVLALIGMDKIKRVIDESLDAEITQWVTDEEGEKSTVTLPDHKTRLVGAKLQLEYIIGKPLERREIVEHRVIDYDESHRMMKISRQYREEALRQIIQAEKDAGVEASDSILQKYR